jgi:excisionase family DNA binding protein
MVRGARRTETTTEDEMTDADGEVPSPDDEWLSTAQAADLLGVVPRTLYRMIDTDGLPAYRIGRPIRLRRGDVLAYIEGARVKPGDLRALYTMGERLDGDGSAGVSVPGPLDEDAAGADLG